MFSKQSTMISLNKLDYRVKEVWAMVFNATFNNISVISWRSVLLVKETGVPGGKSLIHFITQWCIEYSSPWITESTKVSRLNVH